MQSSVTGFMVKEKKRELRSKIKFLVGALCIVLCSVLGYAISIPKAQLKSVVNHNKLVKPFSKKPPSISSKKPLKPELQKLIRKKIEASNAKLARLKKLYRSLATKNLKEKSIVKKLKTLRRSINKQQYKLDKLEYTLSQN